jgi:mRNA-degrading endonuclease RelE of RelBE toxin-antitoxin system
LVLLSSISVYKLLSKNFQKFLTQVLYFVTSNDAREKDEVGDEKNVNNVYHIRIYFFVLLFKVQKSSSILSLLPGKFWVF